MMRDSCDSWGSFSVSTSHASAYRNFTKTAYKLSQLSQPAMEIDVNALVALVRLTAPLHITHGEWRFGLASAPQLRFDGANCNELSLTRKHDTRAITPRIREDCDYRDCHTKAKRRFDSSLSVSDNMPNSEACNARLNGAA